VRFESEVIRLVVQGDSLEVRGLYRFLNRADREVPLALFYPYPVDSLLGEARTVSLQATRIPGGPAPARIVEAADRSGAHWRMSLPPSGALEVRCVYRQLLRGAYARYIVSTTRAWGEPLSSARFEIVLPPGARSPEFSYPFRREQSGEEGLYVFEATRFLPVKDIEVSWRR
jgi:hypothetical protein